MGDEIQTVKKAPLLLTSGEAPPVTVEQLACFTKHLVRNICGRDVIILAAYGAAADLGMEPKELVRLVVASFSEQDRHGFFPKGF